MKIKTDQLARTLKANAHPVYWLNGDEPLLLQEAADQTRQYYRDAGFTDRETHTVDRNFNWGKFRQSTENLSLFAERKIIELRLLQPKLEDEGKLALADFFEADTADLIVLADWTQGSPRMQRVEQLAQSGTDLVIWSSENGAYPEFMRRISNWEDIRDSGRFQGDRINQDNELFRSVFSRIPENPALPVDIKRNRLQETKGWEGMIRYEDGYLQLAEYKGPSSSILLFASSQLNNWLCHCAGNSTGA